MRIERLRLFNWMAYPGEQVLDDLPPAPIGIVAQYVGNQRRSNWAGKTALIEAIGWCLRGLHRKSLDDGIIFHGADACEVEVWLTGGYQVKRSRPRGGPTRLWLLEPGQDSPSTQDAAEERLEKILAMGPQDFKATVAFTQGDTEALVGMRSTDRRKVVERWLELDLWSRVGGAARLRARDALTTFTTLSGQSLQRPEGLRDRSQVEPKLTAAKRARERLQNELASAKQALKLWEEAAQDEGALQELADLEQEGKERRAALQKMPFVSPEEQARAHEVSDAATAEVALAEEELRAAQALVTEGFDGTCPVTCTACPVGEEVQAAREEAKARLEAAEQAFAVAEEKHNEAAAEMWRLDREAAERVKGVALYNEMAARYRKVKARVAARQKRLADLPLEIGGIGGEGLRDDYEELLRLEVEERVRVEGLEAELRELQRAAEQQEKQRKELAAASRKARVAAIAAKALSASGIPARIAEDSLRALEETGNLLLQGSGLSFSLSWERETKELSPICGECGHTFKGKRDKACPTCGATRGMKMSEDMEILVDDGSGEVEDVRAKSGGARVLVASALRLAGAMFLRERRGSRVAWAEVDEPFGPLDAENREALARTFTAMLGSVGLEQAFIVSHDAALLEGLPVRILITREGSASRLTLEG